MIVDDSRVPNVITRDLIKEIRKQENERKCKDGSRGQKVDCCFAERKGLEANESF